ncbi:MAG: Rpn family recombination-promoting nuclease/putative transposase [Venatoribacter sp.]
MANQFDLLNKELFSHPEFVQQLLEGFTSKEISRLLDYSTLKLHSGNYITPLLNEKIEDLVWSVQMLPQPSDKPHKKPTELYLYILLEFQSSRDKTMPLRMLHYTASFYHHLLKEKKLNLNKNKLPPVFPIVLYSGDKKWQIATEIQKLIQPVPAFMKPFLPQQKYFLIEEQSYSFEDLEEINSPLSGTLAVKKTKASTDIERAINLLVKAALQSPDFERIQRIVVRWFKQHLKASKIDINLEHINELEEINTMSKTLKDYLMEEGREEGLKEGLEKGRLSFAKEAVLNLHRNGQMAAKQIASLLQLPLDEVNNILKQNPA